MKRLIPIVLIGVVAFTLFSFYDSAFARSYTAYNWAGYIATAGAYTSISGAWTIPSMSVTKGYSANGQWVGIGGFGSADLIQVGTRAVADDDAITYTAWYELIPAPAVHVPLAVSAGDRVAASLREATPSSWQITLTNETSAKSFTTTVAYHSSHSSAEWIEEMPRGATDYLPLGDFSPITFTDLAVDGAGVPARAVSLHSLTMIANDGTALAAPSLFTANSFTVARSI